MGRIVATEFISLDGVIEDPGGAEGFAHAGWSFKFDRGEDGHRFKFDEVIASKAMLLGRRTYEAFAQSWPEREGEFADRFNALPKYVVSSTLTDPSWDGTTVLGDDAPAAARKLKAEVDGDVYIHGSAQLVQDLLEHDELDELRLMTFPVVLGQGKRLFGETSDMKPMRLKECKAVGEGVTITVYEGA
jgi:dihydrofolate reductase